MNKLNSLIATKVVMRNPQSAYNADNSWLELLANAIKEPSILLEHLLLPIDEYQADIQAKKLFAFRVPEPFVAKMEKGNPQDPLFLQVMSSLHEFKQVDGFVTDPLEEQENVLPAILHKYHNRLLLIIKGGCAINCRYCFRRHFPYQQNQGGKANLLRALEYIQQHPEIEEVILSGGDPLLAKDQELAWLITELEKIRHIKTLRIHSRLPVVIPQRITDTLCHILANCRFKTVLVTHINHPNEIDDLFASHINKLKMANVTLLNQSVLLKDINNDPYILKQLSDKLFAVGILPYYLHLLDKVMGASHFYISDQQALEIYNKLQSITSGYLVPKLAREIGNKPHKVLYS